MDEKHVAKLPKAMVSQQKLMFKQFVGVRLVWLW